VNAGTLWCRRCCIFQQTIMCQFRLRSRMDALTSRRIINSFRDAAEYAVDIVYPKRCAGCGQRGTWICVGCDAALPLFTTPRCHRCGVPASYPHCECSSTPENLEQVRSVGPFDGWLRGAIVHFKFHGEWARAAHLGKPLAAAVADMRQADALIAVPLHAARLRQRGFNQSLLLAQHAGALLGIEVKEALIRTRRTDAQVNLGSEQRTINVTGAFAVKPNFPVAGLSITLIDDVITTGSTLSACAEALITAGATSVSAASLAREM